MKYALSIFYTFLIFSFSTAQNIQNHSIHFDFDKYVLNQEATTSLDDIHSALDQVFKYEIEIIGHTDQDGDYDYNNILAQKRAKTVYDYLISKGASAKNISYLSKGEYDLLYPTNDDESKAKNRRVEIITKLYMLETVEDLMAMLSPESNQQDFAISPNIQQRISGQEGTIVDIPENAFVFEDGSSPNGTVKISLTEAFDYNSFMNHDLSCRSNDELLESGGMIKITASSEGKELKMKEGKEIQLTYPESKLKEGMELFYGEETAEGVSNWEATDVEAETLDEEMSEEMKEKIMAIIDLESLYINPEEPKMPIFDLPEIPSKPRLPQKPYKPYKPQKPNKENTYVYFSIKDKLFMSQTEKQKKIDEAFKKKYDQFAKDSIRYEKKLASYNKTMSTFDERLEKAHLAIVNWEEEIERRRYLLGHYYSKLNTYRSSKMIYNAQNYLEKNIDNPDKYEVLRKYNELLMRKEITIDNSLSKRYYQKLFGNAKNSDLPYEYIRNKIYKDGRNIIRDEELEAIRNKNRVIKTASSTMFHKIRILTNENKTIHDIGNYVMTTSRLGWINCDRFIQIKEEDKRELALQADKNTKFYLAFNDINAMLIPNRIGNEISFKGVPVGKEVTIVGIKLKDSKPQIFFKEMTVSEDEHIAPNFQTSTIDEISAVFAKMGS